MSSSVRGSAASSPMGTEPANSRSSTQHPPLISRREEVSSPMSGSSLTALSFTRTRPSLATTNNAVDAALRDCFNTAAAIRAMLELISRTNVYMTGPAPKPFLLRETLDYVTSILAVFGASTDEASTTQDSGVMTQFADAMCAFRDRVRATAQCKDGPQRGHRAAAVGRRARIRCRTNGMNGAEARAERGEAMQGSACALVELCPT